MEHLTPAMLPGVIPRVPGPRDEPWSLGPLAPRHPPDRPRLVPVTEGVFPGGPVPATPGGLDDLACALTGPPECDGCEELGGTCQKAIYAYNLDGSPRYFYSCRTGLSANDARDLATRCWCAQANNPGILETCPWYESISSGCGEGGYYGCGEYLEGLMEPLEDSDRVLRCPPTRDPQRYTNDTLACRRRVGI